MVSLQGPARRRANGVSNNPHLHAPPTLHHGTPLRPWLLPRAFLDSWGLSLSQSPSPCQAPQPRIIRKWPTTRTHRISHPRASSSKNCGGSKRFKKLESRPPPSVDVVILRPELKRPTEDPILCGRCGDVHRSKKPTATCRVQP